MHTNPITNLSPSKAEPPNDHDHQTYSNSEALTIKINEINNEISSSTDYSPQPLAHNWTQGIYTDGCKTEEIYPYTGRKTTITGAACYDAYEALTPEGGKLYLINPNGQCETNTINRAEINTSVPAGVYLFPNPRQRFALRIWPGTIQVSRSR